ncbi:MAG: hypothetical protein MUP82_04015, partial [Candidatus Marinimicrobia bacterium]|nr:hypothetical protein [Candidatus Neomarinimicrobiota bacterium]
DEWDLHGEAEIDEYKSSDVNKGSIKLSKTAQTWQGTDNVISKYKVPVIPGKTYEITYKLYSESWPPPTIHVTGVYHSNSKRLFNDEGSYYSSSDVNDWENNTLFLQIPNDPDIKYVELKISMLPKYGRNANIWIDNIRINKITIDRTFDLKNKQKFNGSLTRIDELGNIEIFKDGAWTPFFMFGIYTDKNRVDWNTYSEQGFNTNMWASSSEAIKKGKNSQLYSNLQVGQYIIDVDWLPKNKSEKLKHLENTIDQIKNDGLMKDIIFYYIDNEFYDIPDQLINVTNRLKKLDYDKNQERMHPIYMLNGAYGLARKYNDIVDVTGTYVALDRTDRSIVHNFTGLQINENQHLPAVIAQINRGVGLNFRPILFGAIAKGAKGLGFWRDGGSGIDIEKAIWWNDFPNIVKEIKQMIPLIREPHFTDWTVECDNDNLIFGSRMYDHKGHLIIANPSNKKIQANFTITDIQYQISSVKDYFTDTAVGDVDNNVITVTLNQYGSKVIRLD